MTNPVNTPRTNSKLEEVLRRESGEMPGQIGQQQPDLRTQLERELEGEDTELAKELQRTRAEELIARRRQAIARISGAMIPGADVPAAAKSQDGVKSYVLEVATALLEKGVDAAVVGKTIDYMLGNAMPPVVGIPGMGTPAGGISFADIKSIFEMGMSANRTDSSLAGILSRLVDKVESLEKRAENQARAPAQMTKFVRVHNDGRLEALEPGQPIIIHTAVPQNEGESIELIREKNRHEEEKIRLKQEQEYKTSIATTLADIPKRVGEGLASHIMESEAAEEDHAEVRTEPFKCENADCPGGGREIHIPQNANSITCPWCHTVYSRNLEIK